MAHKAFKKALEALVREHFSGDLYLLESLSIEHEGKEYSVDLRVCARPVYKHIPGEHFEDINDMLDCMKEVGGTWEPADDPLLRFIGYERKTEPTQRFYISLTNFKNGLNTMDNDLRESFQTAAGRQKVAESCSS